MKTEIINICANGTGTDEALALTEKTGAYCGLDHKEDLRLRLLGEELIELMRSFTDELIGEFWLECNGKDIEIHLKTEISLDVKTRDEIIAISSSGKNAAVKGIMSKIREVIAITFLPNDPETKAMTDVAFACVSIGNQMGMHSSMANYVWSMNDYINTVEKAMSVAEGNSEAQEAKDELEKSIVANLADDVKVSIVNSIVEVTIYKSF